MRREGLTPKLGLVRPVLTLSHLSRFCFFYLYLIDSLGSWFDWAWFIKVSARASAAP